METKTKFILFLYLLSTFSCITESCPPSEFIGTITLSSISKDLLPYEGVRGLIFENASSDEITLLSEFGLKDSSLLTCVFKPCAILLVDETCLNMEIDQRSIVFESDSFRIASRVFWTLPNDDEEQLDTNYVETIRTNISKSTDNIRTHFISNSRGVTLDSEFENAFSTQILDQVTLINRTFTEVYTKDELIWFSKGLGIVGFKLNDELYELKEIIR